MERVGPFIHFIIHIHMHDDGLFPLMWRFMAFVFLEDGLMGQHRLLCSFSSLRNSTYLEVLIERIMKGLGVVVDYGLDMIVARSKKKLLSCFLYLYLSMFIVSCVRTCHKNPLH